MLSCLIEFCDEQILDGDAYTLTSSERRKRVIDDVIFPSSDVEGDIVTK